MDLVATYFWDCSGSSQQTTEPLEAASSSNPAEVPVEEDAQEAAEPSRDEVTDQSREDQDGESRDEERIDNHHRNQIACEPNTNDVSMFSTLTELLFNPFLDGYCKTPFCPDGDYLPPSCPSGRFYYTSPQQTPYGGGQRHQIKSQQAQDYHGCDDPFGDICRSNSGASSGVGSHGRRRRQRPLAFAVGHGDEWKDLEGRRVVITRSHQQSHTSPKRSPYRYRPSAQASACTCKAPQSNNSLTENANSSSNDPNLSPHQTKAVMCNYCKLQELEVPASRSSGTISSRSHLSHAAQAVLL